MRVSGYVSLLLLVASVAMAVVYTDCNEYGIRPKIAGHFAAYLTSTEIPFTGDDFTQADGGVCSAYDGMNSCCDSAALDGINNLTTHFYEQLNRTADFFYHLHKAEYTIKQFAQNVTNAIDAAIAADLKVFEEEDAKIATIEQGKYCSDFGVHRCGTIRTCPEGFYCPGDGTILSCYDENDIYTLHTWSAPGAHLAAQCTVSVGPVGHSFAQDTNQMRVCSSESFCSTDNSNDPVAVADIPLTFEEALAAAIDGDSGAHTCSSANSGPPSNPEERCRMNVYAKQCLDGIATNKCYIDTAITITELHKLPEDEMMPGVYGGFTADEVMSGARDGQIVKCNAAGACNTEACPAGHYCVGFQQFECPEDANNLENTGLVSRYDCYTARTSGDLTYVPLSGNVLAAARGLAIRPILENTVFGSLGHNFSVDVATCSAALTKFMTTAACSLCDPAAPIASGDIFHVLNFDASDSVFQEVRTACANWVGHFDGYYQAILDEISSIEDQYPDEFVDFFQDARAFIASESEIVDNGATAAWMTAEWLGTTEPIFHLLSIVDKFYESEEGVMEQFLSSLADNVNVTTATSFPAAPSNCGGPQCDNDVPRVSVLPTDQCDPICYENSQALTDEIRNITFVPSIAEDSEPDLPNNGVRGAALLLGLVAIFVALF